MNEHQRIDLGQRATKARTRRGWSKEKLADEAGVTTTTLRRIEAGLRVQDAKLAAVLGVLQMTPDGPVAPERWPDEQMHPMAFVIPPEIDRGYENVVLFAQAVMREVPALKDPATQLILDAARLFSDAGQDILDREGGDERVDATRGPAPMTLAANDGGEGQQAPGAAEDES